jgi:hypothetical protein
LPRLFLPIKMIGDAELHDGGSTSFTLVFLLMMSKACFRKAAPFRRDVVVRILDGAVGGSLLDSCSQYLPERI